MSDEPIKPKHPLYLTETPIGLVSGSLRCVAYRPRRTRLKEGGYQTQRILIFKCRCGEYVECAELAWIECEPKPIDCGCGFGMPRPKKRGRKEKEEGVIRKPWGYCIAEPVIQRIQDLAKVKGWSKSWVADQCLRIGLEQLEKVHT